MDELNLELAKTIILDMLSIDDESLDILLDEVLTRDDLKSRLRAPFDEVFLSRQEVKEL